MLVVTTPPSVPVCVTNPVQRLVPTLERSAIVMDGRIATEDTLPSMAVRKLLLVAASSAVFAAMAAVKLLLFAKICAAFVFTAPHRTSVDRFDSSKRR